VLRTITSERVQGAQNVEDEQVLSFKDVFSFLKRVWWLIGITILLGVGVAAVYSFLQTPQYLATNRILIGQENGFIGPSGNVNQLQDITQTMASAARSRPVAEEVIQQQGLNLSPDALLSHITATQQGQTQFLQVNFTDNDPETARLMADTVSEVFSRQVSEATPNSNAVSAVVWERAALPEEPFSPDYVRNIAIGLIGGAILGLGLALLTEYIFNSQRSTHRRRSSQ
jgi:receptor protein-tyrosine kinase